MALTANRIVALALEASHSGQGKFQQAQDFFNVALSDYCQIYDDAAARGQFVFNFTPGAIPNAPLPVTPASNFGSGPYHLPLDYLRMSGSSGSKGAQRSFMWWLSGVPYPLIPVELAEFDMQVQQAGLQSYVWLYATDLAANYDDRILLYTTGNLTAGNILITGLESVQRLVVGASQATLGIAGQGIIPGTTVVGVNAPGFTCTLSQPALNTIPNASLMFGYPPSMWLYPPPSSAQEAMIRYQRRMPPVTDFTRVPWLDYDGYLIDKVTGHLCQLNDDSRAGQLLGGPNVIGSPDNKLSLWLSARNDQQSAPKVVELDRRRFGSAYQRLKNTKRVGW